MNDQPSGVPPAGPPGDSTTKIPRPAAGDFQPDVPTDVHVGTVAPPQPKPNADFAGDPTREPIAFDAPREPAMDTTPPEDDTHLVPGASVGGGRYRLLVFHGGPPGLQFWQALDTALDRQVALTFVDPDRTLPAEQVQDDPGPHAQIEPPRTTRRGTRARRDQHRFGWPGGLGVDSRRLTEGGCRHLALPDRRRARDPGAGGRRRDGPRGRRRTVHRSPQSGAGQHRR